jgi:WD40 repeat protein
VHTLTGHLGGVLSVAFSPNGTRVVSGSADHLVKIWDAATGTEVRKLCGSAFREVSWWGDSCGGFAHALRWKCSDERVGWQVCTLTGPRDNVRSVDFSPDGKSVVSGSEDNLVIIWDIETAVEVRKFCGGARRVVK